MEFTQELKIPKERVPILIGKKGLVKKQLQYKLKINLKIDSYGVVVISGEDNLKVYDAKNIIHAIARGFNPEIALKLMDEENCYESINMSDYARGSKSKLIRMKGRMIGTSGRARRYLEEITRCNIIVYGKTVSIIGKIENVQIARKGIENLLRGSKHSNVYLSIEKQIRKDL